MAFTARRFRRYAARLVLAGLPAVMVAGCGAPQFTYVTDSAAQTYFKVPHGWHKIDDSFLGSQLTRGGFTSGSGLWDVGYDAGGGSSASQALSDRVPTPFAVAFVGPLTRPASNAMSYNLLRDIILPVTSASRRAAAQNGFPLTGFQLLGDSVIAPGKGVHGIREVFSYTFPDGSTDTFDQVALTNSDDTMVYLLLLHCLSACYHQNFSEINTVMTSFTVRSP